ncbi:hypothetical protein [Acinetobacter venetianus]|uniref:hypothetical protein n=1 Tax=Acinetobacter venetianus TaxID=52133 RepID=UPI000778836F|nr:hypothetical protein [Acinetobacter venetianus]KXZ65593.1 hypothetical protein AVENLUH7437_01370 [Acinetobacter venetianus]
MNAVTWFHELSCYKQLNQAQRLFMTRFPSYEAFKAAHRKLQDECRFFSIEIPKNSRGKHNALDVIELMMEMDQLEKECA